MINIIRRALRPRINVALDIELLALSQWCAGTESGWPLIHQGYVAVSNSHTCKIDENLVVRILMSDSVGILAELCHSCHANTKHDPITVLRRGDHLPKFNKQASRDIPF